MANIVKLGSRPKTFAPVAVEFTGPDGETYAMEVTYTYRTKKEFGAWLDQGGKDASKQQETTGEDFSWETFYEKLGKNVGEQLSGVITGWNLEQPVSAESLAQLDDELPAASIALLQKYGNLCREGRLGN